MALYMIDGTKADAFDTVTVLLVLAMVADSKAEAIERAKAAAMVASDAKMTPERSKAAMDRAEAIHKEGPDALISLLTTMAAQSSAATLGGISAPGSSALN